LIKISSKLLKRLTQYCMSHLPNEACGAFFGDLEQDHIVIQYFTPIANIANEPGIQFEFDRAALLELLYPSQESQSPWIGIFHSHPLSAPYPSDQDILTQWHLPVYGIISFAPSEQPMIKFYEITADQQKKPCSIKEQAFEITSDLY
jgi:proteasome lid subunit RPN8/RPN11